MKRFKAIAVFSFVLLMSGTMFAQKGGIRATLIDKETGEGVEFATVSITLNNQTKPTKYVLSDSEGKVDISQVRKGTYVLRAELLGYNTFAKEITIEDKVLELGVIEMAMDSEQIEAATISELANPVVIKKDTIEYNAAAYRITDNDVLEDLLLKLPGVEVDDNGGITVNGESVSKITVSGKTFFLNDPTLASQNIPAKLVRKLKVIKKKSEQAEFTGIDDGEEQTVIDISVKPGMMQGLLGNVTAGAGHDVPSEHNSMNDWRYTGNAFLGSFTDNAQISVILNTSNTNGRGGRRRGMGGMSGGMGGGMMMGGGGMGMMMGMMGGGMSGMAGGITTTHMAGVNGAWTLFDGNMEFGGNYMFNNMNNLAEQSVSQINFEKALENGQLVTRNVLSESDNRSTNNNYNHSVGFRLDHKFSENTSILFEPTISFGTGKSAAEGFSDSFNESKDNPINKATTESGSDSKNVSANGFFLFRQRLGLPGRTLTANVMFNLSNSTSDGFNNTSTTYYNTGGIRNENQLITNVNKNYMVMSTVTFTEPMGDNFYIEANYSYNWTRSESDKKTIDAITKSLDGLYSNNVVNDQKEQQIGAHALYQSDKMSAQVGFSAIPTKTYNSTSTYTAAGTLADPRIYDEPVVWRFSPTVMLLANPNDSWNIRTFYTGNNNQPSVNQLMPVPNNADPLNISFGNPGLTPYFSHNLRMQVRYNNKMKMSSFNININGGYTQSPISNISWRDINGVRYSIPFNGKDRGNASFNMFFNLPIGKSSFSVNNQIGANFSRSTDYQGTGIDMTSYETKGFYAFMDELCGTEAKKGLLEDESWYKTHILENTTDSYSFNERMRVTYRGKAFEATLGASTRMSHAVYSLTKSTRTTWNNQIQSSFTWDWASTGISVDIDYDYRWYRGYDSPQPSQNVLNIELSKLILHNNVTLSLSAYDVLGQSRNFTVSDSENYHTETLSNTLGRYIVLSATWRFGSMGNRRRGGGAMGGGMPPMMGGGMMPPMR